MSSEGQYQNSELGSTSQEVNPFQGLKEGDLVTYSIDQFQSILDDNENSWNPDDESYEIQIKAESQCAEVVLKIDKWESESFRFEIDSYNLSRDEVDDEVTSSYLQERIP